MKNKPVYSFDQSTRESGVALIFALAILSLLLLTLIGFLSSALFEQRIAYNQSGQSSARLIAQSALNQAISILSAQDSRDELMSLMAYGDSKDLPSSSDDLDDFVRLTTPFCSFYDYTASGNIDMSNGTTALSRIQNLLDKRGIDHENYNWDKKIKANGADKDNHPYWIPMTVTVPDTDDATKEYKHITGRYAYVMLPNLGLDPYLLGNPDNSENPEANRIGVKYNEMPLSGLDLYGSDQTDWQKLGSQKNWLSLDLMTSKYALGKGAQEVSGEAKEDFFKDPDKKELVNTYFTTRQKIDDSKYDSERTNLGAVITKESAKELAKLIDSNNTVQDQIAANIVDYMDSDGQPTSDIEPSSWGVAATHPTYTGNEKTPYINQIIPALQITGNFTKTETSSGGGGFLGGLLSQTTITMSATFSHKGRLYFELINIYPEQLTAKKLVLKNLKFSLSRTAQVGRSSRISIGGADNFQTIDSLPDATIDLTVDEVVIDSGDITVSAKGYAVVSSNEITFSGTIPEITWQKEFSRIELTALTPPKLEIEFQVTDCQFDRAVLLNNDTATDFGIDYVKGLKADNLPKDLTGVITVDGTGLIPDADTTYAWRFENSGESKTISGYLSFAVDDPRFNLADSEWEATFERNNGDFATATIPNYGSRNSDTDASNNNINKEKDLEPEEDPVLLSTAYIRNGAMESVWELGFIHRGKAWQTINLKSADDNKDKTYFNDAVLLDEVYISHANHGDDEPKFNINYPHIHLSAFGALTKGLKFCSPADELLDVSGKLDLTAGDNLTDIQWRSLRKWIAHKCYASKDGNPEELKEAKNYHFYRHRGYLANVIMDWALNSDDSPYKGQDLLDAYLEELIGKITPLTRADGDPYEYFTIFAVAQSIKDMGEADPEEYPKKLIKYDIDGNKIEAECRQGTWEKDFDEVTGETYLIARVRRKLNCSNAASCQDGLHTDSCKYEVEVIESYTLSEL